MHVNHEYLLKKAEMFAPVGRVLDFGCGDAALVAEGITRGLDFFGTDDFSCNPPDGADRAGLLGDRVREMRGSERIPFPDEHFALVVSNQVFEHVPDLAPVLAEIHRVLAPGGALLALFPARDVIREGHYGIPFSHWFPKGSRARFHYALALRHLGLGALKGNKPPREWAAHAMDYLDRATFYRPRREIRSLLSKNFAVQNLEDDYCRFRLAAQGLGALNALYALPLFTPFANEALRRLSGMVVLGRKADPNP